MLRILAPINTSSRPGSNIEICEFPPTSIFTRIWMPGFNVCRNREEGRKEENPEVLRRSIIRRSIWTNKFSERRFLYISESLPKILVVAKLNSSVMFSFAVWQGEHQVYKASCGSPCRPHTHHHGYFVHPVHHCTVITKHLWRTCSRSEQSNFLPDAVRPACSTDGTDNRRQRLRQTKRPPSEPSHIDILLSLNYNWTRCLDFTANTLTVSNPVLV